MSRIRSVIQGVLVLVGLFLLGIAIPYRSSLLQYYIPPLGERTAMEITIPLPGIPPILFSPVALIIAGVAAAALTLFLAGLAPAIQRLAMQRRGRGSIVATGLLFLLTLCSGFVNVGFDSLKASGRLTLGLISFILIVGNSIPLLRASRVVRLADASLSLAWGSAKEGVLSMKPWHFAGMVFLVEFALTSGAAYFVFDRVPHVVDSIAQLFHAKIFAMGKLTVPSPPMPEFFEMVHMINNGQWYSQFPPGHSALLAPGVLLGVPWLINPLLGSGTVVLIYKLGVELYGEGVGRVSALLALVSPFLLFMSAEMMSHTSAMFFFTLFVLSFVKALKERRVPLAVVAGCGLGMLMCIRPYTGAAVSLPFLLYGAYSFFKERRTLALPALGFVLATSVFIVLLLLFNYQTNGSPFVFGYQVLWGSGVLPGLGNAAWGKPLTLVQGIFNTMDNLLGLQKFLFEWPLPSLLPLAILFLAGTAHRWDKLLVAGLGSLSLAYGFYWFQHWLYGPRFLFEVMPILLLLTARGLQQFPELLKRFGMRVEDVERHHARTAGIILICAVMGLAANVPRLIRDYSVAGQVEQSALEAGEKMGIRMGLAPHVPRLLPAYRGNGPVNRDVLDAVERMGIRRAVVFTQSNYGAVFPANSPDLKSGIVFVRDLRNEKNRILLKSFPGYESFRAFNAVVEPYDPGHLP
jgi:hypothetical protein